MALADELRIALDDARADLLAAFAGAAQEEFVRPPEHGESDEDERWTIRDVLWHVGLVEDWFRRMIDQADGARPIAAFERRKRPPYVDTPDLLQAWLLQTRRPLLALLGRLHDGALEREFILPEGEVRTPRRLLAYLARHDREHAAQVRSLRASAAAESR